MPGYERKPSTQAVDSDCQLRLKLQLLTIMSVCVLFRFSYNMAGGSTDICRGRAKEQPLLLMTLGNTLFLSYSAYQGSHKDQSSFQMVGVAATS